ncbi:MAG: energy-coupling factor transporter transmembrane protein EcfT [Anaerolineaceae bacterium]|jgi:energy-coupling factor transport system permease protein|nr:MAG: energy-coupling factor transporter transmembrane protein EcfT [Anaerolineaceae bacterium]
MKKIAYTPANTMLHTLHPFTKFSILLGISVFVFFVDSPTFMVFLLIMLVSSFLAVCKNPFAYFGMRTIFMTALTIGIIQCIFLRQGNELLNIAGLSITDYGIQRAVLISIRFLVIILSSYLFILTTSPSDFAFAFMQMGVPYRYAFMIVTSMRLVPILSIDGERISYAQRLRGARYDLRNPRETILHMNTFIGAVLYSLINRVNKLAISMESRSFGRYETRTYQKPIHFTYRDGIALVLALLVVLLSHFMILKGIV